jgi:hypothetical protein
LLHKPELTREKTPQTVTNHGAGGDSLSLIRYRTLVRAGSIVIPNLHLRAAALFCFVYIAALSSSQTKSRELGALFQVDFLKTISKAIRKNSWISA